MTAILCTVLAGCQSASDGRIDVVADGRIVVLGDGGRSPADVLRGAGIQAAGDELVLNRGNAVDIDMPIPLGQAIHIQVNKAAPVLLNGNPVLTTAQTVAAAVRDQGFELHAADFFDPPAETPIVAGMVISFAPSTLVKATVDGTARQFRAAKDSAGPALADAGIPLQGLDVTSPSEANSLGDGDEARLTRVTDSVLLDQVTITYQSETSDSPELEVGLEQVLQPGTPGLAVIGTRIRRQDWVEVSRSSAPQVVVLEPQARVVVRGTRLVERTETIGGVSITYWRKLQMYATVYSPCNSATADGSCSTGTASGRPAGKGVVAVDPGLYAYLNGQRLYIPGYGLAVIGDIGGGYIVEQNLGISRYKWIDLGFDDNDIEDMTGWIDVYFLAPAPASIPDLLR